jgi:hypothetical protein
MLEDIDFSESEQGEIRIEIRTGAKVSYPVPVSLAAKLLKQLGEILGRRWAKQQNERLGHVVEVGPTPRQSEAATTPATEEEQAGGA